MTTGELTTAVMDALTLKGYVVWRNNSGKARRNVRMAPPGTPDIIGYAPNGTFVGVEIKAEDDELSDTQRGWLDRAGGCGCYTYVVYSMRDIETIVESWR